MTAPIWMAAPPEVHSALLSSGPGPGSLLVAAGEWTSLSITYAEAAEELAALLAAVQAGAWDGPTAEIYVAAHVPYLMWLIQASANSAAMAGQQQTAAAAYTAALAAMPTLAELGANHTIHTGLVVTNFFGINTIPIAVNEADYVRMWIQAAAVMGGYQDVSATAVAAAPQPAPAPPIMNAAAPAAAAAQAAELPPDRQSQFLQWLNDIGYVDLYNKLIKPFVDWLANIPFLQALFSGFDPYLLTLGNPLTYLSPLNIAFALGYPMDFATYVTLLSQTFAFIGADLAAAFASGNPMTIGLTILFTSVEAIGTIITDTIALLKTLLEQTAVLLAALAPMLAAPLVPLAAGAVLVPLGAKGLAALVAVPPPALPVAAPAAPPVALTPNVPPTPPAPAPVDASTLTLTQAPPPPPSTAPPPVSGAGLGVGMENFGYMVGGLGADAKSAARASARKKAPRPDGAEVPVVAPAPSEPARSQRRRRTKVGQLGRGFEYMDLESETAPDSMTGSERITTASGLAGSAGTFGFSGVAGKSGDRTAAGLIKVAGDGYDDGPRTPAMPSTWDGDPAPSPD
ncbi:PPE family protein [Mycobacterium marinum]|uniref:PPE family protein n=10 Tax=Mycobacterium marinum TaxID=1781 RepID=UPI00045FBB38|nr:PPE family protein [Mycobacterium marinum]AXN44898.1 putative PPE family protein PPE47/PPE48 [Mycobacterium marinum]RFZ04077.1 putative PPE family protein PPE47/PPE48 [Mycobacterium marinum]CDM77011.1 PPE family protein [Mycobacterium marinum E11]GJO64799.1 PPE family protein [Mycobacterium marinum]GJP12689.1 PPE family protein [Mycobacterium marinum]